MEKLAVALILGLAITASSAIFAQTPDQINAATERKGSKEFDANKRLAEQGNADAQFLVSIAYFSGDGVKADMERSVTWMRKAADSGLPEAQNLMGTYYLDGVFVPKDEKQGVQWIRKAAEHGDAEAQLKLGDLYAAGTGIKKSDQDAYFWWLLSSAQGNKAAKKKRDKVEKKLTSQQFDDAQAQAKAWRVN